MKKILLGILAATLLFSTTACSSGKEELLSKTPFPEFSEMDTQGNPITKKMIPIRIANYIRMDRTAPGHQREAVYCIGFGI